VIQIPLRPPILRGISVSAELCDLSDTTDRHQLYHYERFDNRINPTQALTI